MPKRFRKIIFTLDELVRGKPSVSRRSWDLPSDSRVLHGNFGPVVKEAPLTEGTLLLNKIRGSLLAPFDLFFRVQKLPKSVGVNVGKRAETVTALHRGRPSGWRFPRGKPRDIHLPATIRAAALEQRYRQKPNETALQVLPEDVREKSRMYKAPMTIVLVIDLSKSMMYNIEQVREAVLKLHGDAYRYRDKVGIVVLKGTNAVVVQHPITNLRVVANKLLKLHISGFTPLAAGILKAREVLNEAKRRDRSTIPVMVIVTDGNANVPLKRSLQTGEVRTFDPLDAAFFKYEDIAINDIISVSEMIKKEGINTVVVNTNPVLMGWQSSGLLVTRMIAKVTNGSHHEVGRILKPEHLVDAIFEAITEDERSIAHKTSSK